MSERKSPTIYGDGQQSRDFTFVENAVLALMLAAEAKDSSGHVYNIGTGHNTTLINLVNQLNALFGTAIVPNYQSSRPGEVRDSLADISQATCDLGYRPVVAIAEGLKRTIESQLGE